MNQFEEIPSPGRGFQGSRVRNPEWASGLEDTSKQAKGTQACMRL